MFEPQLSDQNWNTVVLAIIGGVNTIILAVITTLGVVWVAKINRGNVTVAEKVAEVKDALHDSDTKTADELSQIKTTGENTHKLVNGAMSAQMKLTAVALRRTAQVTKDPGDIEAAELAEKALAEHLAKQPAQIPGVALPDVVKVELVPPKDKRTGTQKAANESRKSTRE